MKRKSFYISIFWLSVFVLWTSAVKYIDVQVIGPKNTAVGLASINSFFRDLIGVNMTLYSITDWLGLVPLAVVSGFALLGLVQWIKRKNFLKVDFSILVLGVFYFAVAVFYIFFETAVINYRPVLINGGLETSYPSSTTMLAMCVMPTALMQFNIRIKRPILRNGLAVVIIFFTVFMVVGRLVSGVHWFSDIIGGFLLSTGLVTMYCYFSNLKQ